MSTPRRRTRTGQAALLAATATLSVLVVQPGPAVAGPVAAGPVPASADPTVAVLVTGRPGAQAEVLQAVHRAGGRVLAARAVLDGAEARVPASALPALAAAPGVATVTRNAALQLSGAGWLPDGDEGSLNQIAESTRAKDVWYLQATDRTKATGTGTGVALLDSGVARVAGLDAAGKVIDGPDLTPESRDPDLAHRDTFGHGTHMAGIIAGLDKGMTGHESEARVFAGMAPGAHLVSVKVADAHGATDVSQVIAGIDWVVQHRKDPGLNIRVLNLSFGTDSAQDPRLDPLSHAVENAWRAGIVVVVSAGNSGAATTRLTSPATNPYVVAVGASAHRGTLTSLDDTIAGFSSNGSASRAVDVLAPGTSVASLRDPGSSIDTQYAATGRITTPAAAGMLDPARLFRGSGTSQAAAVVSGAAALLVDQRPALTPDQVKGLLMRTAHPLVGVPRSRQGAGTIDVRAAALTAPLTATQSFPRSTGTGTLEAARGSFHLLDPATGTPLTGEQDLFGTAWSAPTWAAASTAQTSWSGGLWNGKRWTGDVWSGQRWTEGGWDRSAWTRRSWSSGGWEDAAWTSSGWTRRSWSGSSWDGNGSQPRGWNSSGWNSATWQ